MAAARLETFRPGAPGPVAHRGGRTCHAELPSPAYEIRWPAGLDEADPDLSHPELPVQLGTILSDLDRIRADLARVDSEFALASYVWMVKDGMILQPKWNRLLWEDINLRRFPYRYRDIERLVASKIGCSPSMPPRTDCRS